MEQTGDNIILVVIKHFTLQELKHYPKYVSDIFSIIWMSCLNIAQIPATEIHWTLRSPRLLHRNHSLDFIPTVPFQLLFLYANHYLLTFSFTAHLLIQHIMMKLPQTGKILLRAVKGQKTLSDACNTKNI